ncbi:MAG: sigma-70 family RNA polymerase sigma factor [Rhodanobacteraceae bacterium]|nr:sigma-70 family RNA polymerase sigma factor [Rhodanobacteraceae bacterium]
MNDEAEFVQLIDAYRQGDNAAWTRLIKLVYADLRTLAHSVGAGWSRDRTLNTTSLVHECYLRLIGPAGISAENRRQFFALASSIMRRAACDYARERLATKRGGELRRESVDIVDSEASQEATELVEIDDALNKFPAENLRAAGVFECRYFGGLSEQQTADTLALSLRTVQRDWNAARDWLQQNLR